MAETRMWRPFVERAKGTDLRFPRIDEVTFKQSLEEQLVRHWLIGATVFEIAFLIVIVPTYQASQQMREAYPRFDWAADDPRTQYFSIRISQFLFVGLVAILALLRKCCRRLMGWNWELITVCVVAYVLASYPFSIPWHLAKMRGTDPSLVWEDDVRNTELLNLLGLSATLFIACMYVPFRACVLWVLPLSMVVPFVFVVVVVGSPFPVDVPITMFIFIFLALLAYLGARRHERSTREKWRAERQVLRQQEELVKRHEAVSGILTSFCDCVVHLGPAPGFHILDPNPRLAALLLYKDGRTLEGKSICDFVASTEDQTRLVKAFQEAHNYKNGADRLNRGMINIRFRDTHGRDFAVTASYTCIRNAEDEPSYIVGLLEPEERCPLPYEDGKSSVTSAHLGVPLSLAGIAGCIEPSERITVSFDAYDLEVHECSGSFAAIFGYCAPGSPITAFLIEMRNKSFWSKYQDNLNQFIHSQGQGTELGSFHASWVIQMQVPESTTSSREMQAEVTITFSMAQKSAGGWMDYCELEPDIKALAELANIRTFAAHGFGRSSGCPSTGRSSGGSDGGKTVGRGTKRELATGTIGHHEFGGSASPEGTNSFNSVDFGMGVLDDSRSDRQRIKL